MRELGRRAAVVALVAASGATGLGAAFLPDGPLCAASLEPSPVELRTVPESYQAVTLGTVDHQWSQPLTFHCYDAGQGVTCCIISPK